MTKELEVIIGLEVHAQLNTKTKMFCGCDNDAFDKQPNTTVCEICMGHPGTLPVPNNEAIAKSVTASLAIGCTVAPDCHFDRKHYFYPDLPYGYQISQYDHPLAQHGVVHYDLRDGSGKSVHDGVCRIHRLHMENDAGKLSHYGSKTLCDYNRAGTPLMEIVTEPDLRSADEAVAFAEELRRILIAVGASDADMFKGMMRFDASISLREKGTEKLNPRSEIKNLNSFKALERALQYEEKRLRALWDETGGPLKGNITVGWMDDEGKTRMLRDKEDAQDYRYFPEPDIPPLHFTEKEIADALAALPKLPRAQRKEFIESGTTEVEAELLISNHKLRYAYEEILNETKDVQWTRSIIFTLYQAALIQTTEQIVNEDSKIAFELEDARRDTKLLLQAIRAVQNGKIKRNTLKEVIPLMIINHWEFDYVANEVLHLRSVSNDDIQNAVSGVVAANDKSVSDFRNGKQAAFGFLVGQVMKQLGGAADPAAVNELLKKALGA